MKRTDGRASVLAVVRPRPAFLEADRDLLDRIKSNKKNNKNCNSVQESLKVLTHQEEGDATQICEDFANKSFLYTTSAMPICS